MDLWGKAEGGCGAGCFATLYTLNRSRGDKNLWPVSSLSSCFKSCSVWRCRFESLMNLEWGGYSFLVFCFSSRIDI